MEVVNLLLDAATSSRDHALIWCLIGTGCRVAELCGLRWFDVWLDRGEALVKGKGSKERIVFLEEPIVEVLRVWRSEQKPASEYVFTRLNGRPGPLTPSGVSQILRRLKKEAGITDRCNAHSFRHAYGREWVMNGGDVSSLCDEMGHSDISVTRIYLKYALEDRRKKHNRHSPVTTLVEKRKD